LSAPSILGAHDRQFRHSTETNWISSVAKPPTGNLFQPVQIDEPNSFAVGKIDEVLRPELGEGTANRLERGPNVIRDVGPHVPRDVHFIPAHPIAGTEFSGPESGFASLFDGRWAILTPVPGSDPKAVEKLKNFWLGLGSQVDVMDSSHHDLVLAITSHLPHLIAYNIVGTAHDLEQVTEGEVIKYSASGFRDFTRIAASDPTMWRDVFLNNREAVLEVLGRFNEDLSLLQRAVRNGDGQTLFDLFTRTRAIRRAIIDIGQDTAAPNFGRNKT